MSATPCDRNCPGRTAGCHAECEKYKAWKKEREEVKAWLNEQNTSPKNEKCRRTGWKYMRYGSRYRTNHT